MNVMNAINEWMNQSLIEWGIINDASRLWDNVIVLILIVAVAAGVDFVGRKIILGVFYRVAVRTKTDWDDLIFDRRIIHKLISVIPALVIYILLPAAFSPEEMPAMLAFLQRICVICMIVVLIRVVNSSLNLANDLFNRRHPGRSVKGFVQVLQVLAFFIGLIVIIAVLTGESPGALIAGLGASAAVLMLVFKDSLLGFIAGIQLSANDMLRPGDWITMDKYGANGTVIDVTLQAVKVRNFDNTIVTVPPYALISDSFQNWRGMSDSPGRRVKRSVNIDMSSIRFCTPEMLEGFRKISLLSDYIDNKEKELQEHNAKHQADGNIQVNGRRQTNIGVFRAYIERYLSHHPQVSKELTCMVRHLQPSETGLPVELYFFISDKKWGNYESIQADIFDHILAIIPEFGLVAFQNISGADVRQTKRYTPPGKAFITPLNSSSKSKGDS